MHPLRNASKEEGGYLDLVQYCFINIYGYAKEGYERGREGLNKCKLGVM